MLYSFKQSRSAFMIAGILISLFWGAVSCSTEVNPNADYRDIYVVFGVLDGTDSVQYIRIDKAFLINGDAIEYAKNTDVSVKGLNVILKGDGKTYTATQIDSVPTGVGAFYPMTTLYRIDTKGNNALKGGVKYDLSIKIPGNDSFELRAYTYIPTSPTLNTPNYAPGAGSEKSIRKINFNAPYPMEFQNKSLPGKPLGFEARVFLYHEKNGIPDTAVFRSSMFQNGVRCQASGSTMCYSFSAKEVLYEFRKKLSDPTAIYTYDDQPETALIPLLPKSMRFEVTAIDTFLTKYIIANSPQYQDFNTIKPEYTNLKGTKDVYGIFGAINKASAYAILDECGEYLLRLNNTPQPQGGVKCEW